MPLSMNREIFITCAVTGAGDTVISTLAAALAFFSGLAAIILMMRWLEHASFMPFVIYRILLGAGTLILLGAGVLTA